MSRQRHRFGEVAVDLGFITQFVLDSALDFQNTLDKHERIGDILVLRGALDPAKVGRVLQAQEARRLFIKNNGEDELGEQCYIGQILDEFEVLAHFGDASKKEYLVFDNEEEQRAILSYCSGARDSKALKRFLNSNVIYQNLVHPHLIAPYKVKSLQNQYGYAVRRIEDGQKLTELLSEETYLAERDAIRVVQDIGHGLQHIHNSDGLYRTLGADKIYVDEDSRARILLSEQLPFIGSDDPSKQGTDMGSLYYMAPETGRTPRIDGRADLYSLALIFYQCLTGVLPFKNRRVIEILSGKAHDQIPHPRRFLPSCPEALVRILSQALMKDPEERYTTVNEFLDDLAAYQGGRPLQAGPSKLWAANASFRLSPSHLIRGVGRALSQVWNQDQGA